MKHPTLQEERKLWKKGYKNVVCLDEVGRGPLAGPVIAAAVSVISDSNTAPAQKLARGSLSREFSASFLIPGLRDSKKLTPKTRNRLYKIIISYPNIIWAIGKVYPRVIDRINILEATKLAMKKAVEKLEIKLKVDYLILDGKMELDFLLPQKSIVKADEKVFSCAIASIIAKVKRDKAMERYHQKYPQYGFEKHKGYGTKLHIKMLNKFGRCDIHRNSFKF